MRYRGHRFHQPSQVRGDGPREPDVDAGHAGAMDGLASVLGFGRVPFLAWLAIFLLMFSGVGITGQYLLSELLGTMLAPLPAAALAALPALLLALHAGVERLVHVSGLHPK